MKEIKNIIDNIKNIEKEEVDTSKWKEYDFFYLFKENESKTGIISPIKEKISTNLYIFQFIVSILISLIFLILSIIFLIFFIFRLI